MISEDKVYRQLQEEIDTRMPIGFPRSESGLDIKILKELFTPKEANIAIHLSALSEPTEKIHKRVNKKGISISLEELQEILDDMLRRGLINGSAKKKKYSLALFAVGFYEFQVDKQTKELAEVAEDYLVETFYKELHKKGVPPQLRTIPVERSLTQEHHVAPYDKIMDIINKKEEPFSVVNCVCRQSHDLIGEKCKQSDIRRCCVMLHPADEIEYDVDSAEDISKAELLDLMKQWLKAGFVLQPENSQDPRYMCVCCSCCCGVLKAAKQFPKPAEYYSNNFHAKVDLDKCNGCGVCIKRCPMDAVELVEEKAAVNLDRCIGCGNCVPTCGMKAMSLQMKDDPIEPPKTRDQLYTKIMLKKRGVLGSLKMLGKILFKRKV